MKKILVTKLSLLLSFASASVFAHPGHLPVQYVEGVHSFLHIEHVVAIVAVLALGVGITLFRSK